MDELQAKVKQAQRRLWLIRWLGHLGWSLTAAAVVFAILVIGERMILTVEDEGRLLRWAALGLSTAALAASAVWTIITRESIAAAAARLDEAARLKERLSTALFFANSEDPFARAAVTDAHHVSRLVTPRAYLPVRVPRSAPYCGSAFIMALMFFWLFPVLDLAGKQATRQDQEQKREELKQSKEQIQPLVDKLKNLQNKHPELKNQTQPAEALEMAKLDSAMDLRREAMKQLNAAASKVDEKKSRPELAKVEDFRQMLRKLAAQPTPMSPVGNLSQALAKGDFKAAKDTLSSLKSELGKTPGTPEEKAKQDELRSDLKKLADQVGKIAESNSKLKDQMRQLNLSEEDINKLLDKVTQGDIDKMAQELAKKGLSQEQIEKLKQQAEKAMAAKKEASKLAQNIAKAAQKNQDQKGNQPGKQKGDSQDKQANQGSDKKDGQQQGDDQQAQGNKPNKQPGKQPGEGDEGNGAGDQEGLTQAAEQMSEMESLQQELAELNAASSDLNNMKESLGEGGSGEGQLDEPGGGMGNVGQGEGGAAQKQETAFGMTPQRSKVHTMSGAIIDQRFVEGEQYKGEVSEKFVEAVLGAREDISDASRQKSQPRHIKLKQSQYFNHMDEDFSKEKLDAARQKLEVQEQKN